MPFRRNVKASLRGWPDDKRYQPEASLAGHLTFALRHEPLDLLLLKRLFDATRVAEMAEFVASQPTGAWARRSWFLFEWLTGQRLPLPDARTGNYVEALDPAFYVTATAVNSPRHRVRDNLPGTPAFCPVLRKTPALAAWIERELMHAAQETTSRADKRLLSRAASFLLLADSQASFQIEGERPPRNRIERWGRAVLQAGQRPLSVAELERLQSVLIEDSRHVHPGLRREGVFLVTGRRMAYQYRSSSEPGRRICRPCWRACWRRMRAWEQERSILSCRPRRSPSAS
jgi:hypothetical protein